MLAGTRNKPLLLGTIQTLSFKSLAQLLTRAFVNAAPVNPCPL
jgi:hypothetical protein